MSRSWSCKPRPPSTVCRRSDQVHAGLVRQTRISEPACRICQGWLSWGAGPRAVQNLILGAKARALLYGREKRGPRGYLGEGAPGIATPNSGELHRSLRRDHHRSRGQETRRGDPDSPGDLDGTRGSRRSLPLDFGYRGDQSAS